MDGNRFSIVPVLKEKWLGWIVEECYDWSNLHENCGKVNGEVNAGIGGCWIYKTEIHGTYTVDKAHGACKIKINGLARAVNDSVCYVRQCVLCVTGCVVKRDDSDLVVPVQLSVAHEMSKMNPRSLFRIETAKYDCEFGKGLYAPNIGWEQQACLVERPAEIARMSCCFMSLPNDNDGFKKAVYAKARNR